MATAKVYDGSQWIEITDESHRSDAADAHNASAIDYDNTTSGLIATNVQDAVDELEASGGGGGTDELVAVSANDTTPGLLGTKLVAGTDITITENNDGGNETLTIASTASGGGGGGGVSWTQDANETGTSFANFTVATGTWSSNGTIIQQTDTGNQRRARWNTKVALGFPTIHEAEIRFPGAGGSVRRGGLILAADATPNSLGLAVYLDQGTGQQVGLERDGGTLMRMITGLTIAQDTWYKLRVVTSFGVVSVYLDGTLLGSGNLHGAGSFDPDIDYVGLYTHQTAVDFRNIKTWTLTGGAPA